MWSFFSKPGRKAAGSRSRKIWRKTASGLTLVELLVSMVVLAFGIMGVLKVQGATMNTNAMSASMSMAVLLAESQSELLRSMDFNRVAFVSQDPEKITNSGLLCDEAPTEPCFFTRTTTIVQQSPTTVSYAVSIKVEWLNRALVYDTVVSNTGFF